jgi:hypothetical protein
MLSTFEAALLDRHLRRCAGCRAFAAGVAAQTQLLRDAGLERPARPVLVPAGPRRQVRRIAVGAVTTVAAAAAAAAFALTPAGGNGPSSSARATAATGAPVLVVVAAHPSVVSNDTVPRLRMRPASIADGPVHGLFNTPALQA